MMLQEERRALCIHEASHAVIAALGGAFVRRVAIGAEAGFCVIEGFNVRREFIWWDDDAKCYASDRAAFESYAREIERQTNSFDAGLKKAAGIGANAKNTLTRMRKDVRVSLCTLLAGPIADAICAGEDTWSLVVDFDFEFDTDDTQGHDIPKALALASLLPSVKELEHARISTEAMLRRPEIWGHVQALAELLALRGELCEELETMLPPVQQGWPTSPQTRVRPPK